MKTESSLLVPAFAAFLGTVAALMSSIGVKAICRFAEQRQLLDVPNERSSHTRPTPRGGGLAIAVVTLALTLAAHLIVPQWSWPALLLTLAAWALVAAVSLADDLRSLPNSLRFCVHAIAAVLILVALGHSASVEVPLLGQLSLGLAGTLIAFSWLVGLTNAYNFMDGIDGIAGAQATVAGLVWAISGYITGAALLSAIGLIITGTALGFLRYNWPPARIFMGDVGSAFLGLSLASLAVAGAKVDPHLTAVGVLAVWPFIFDTSFTFLRRAVKRENVFAAHRSHLYQRLVIVGHGHRTVALLYATFAAIGGILGIAWLIGVWSTQYVIAIWIPLSSVLLWCYVVARERERKLSLGNPS